MYEIFEKLLEINGLTIYKFCKDTQISESTIYTWRKKKSIARPELAEKVCEYFKVSIDFLMGKTNQIECSECGQKYDPFDEFDCAIHEQFHSKILEAQRVYSSLIPYKDIATIRSKSLSDVQNNKDNRLESMQEYLKAEFSYYVYINFEHGKQFDYDNFCKTEIVKLIENGEIPNDYIDDIIKVFNIDRNYINQTDVLLARVCNNPQMMRILTYAEKLTPGMLDALEVQIKALADNNTKG